MNRKAVLISFTLLFLITGFRGYSFSCAVNSPITTQETLKDTLPKPELVSDLMVVFQVDSIDYGSGSLISNVLKIWNTTDKKIKFSTDIIGPGSWRIFSRTDVLMEILPKDTMFLPVRLVPSKSFSGTAKILINAFVVNEWGERMGSSRFTVHKHQILKWDLSPSLSGGVYLKNDQTTQDLSVTLSNLGGDDIPLFLQLKSLSKNILFYNSLKLTGLKFNKSFVLPGSKDTTLKLDLSFVEPQRNSKTISLMNYSPDKSRQELNYRLYISSQLSQISGKSSFSKGGRVMFKKLPNIKTVGEASGASLPITVDATIQNILGNQPTLLVNLNGRKQIREDEYLYYNTFLSYNRLLYNTKQFNNLPWYLAYFGKKLYISLGQVNGGYSGVGGVGNMGVKGGYKINTKQTIEGYYVQKEKFFSTPKLFAYGIRYKNKIKKNVSISSSIEHGIDNILKRQSVSGFLSSGVKLGVHNVSISTGLTGHKDSVGTTTAGYLLGGNYSTILFDKKFSININSSYRSPRFTRANNSLFYINNTFNYKLPKNWNAVLRSTVNQFSFYQDSTNALIQQTLNNYNELSFTKAFSKISYTPSLYVTYNKMMGFESNAKGISLRASSYNLENNSMITVNVKGGYNTSSSFLDYKNYFNLTTFILFRKKNISTSVTYSYGPTSTSALIYLSKFSGIPQILRTSFNHQYQFKDKRLILDQSINYMYSSQLKSSILGYQPSFYFYTFNDWRFSVTPSINYRRSSSIASESLYSSTSNNSTESNINSQFNFYLGFNFRKEFNIKVPFIKPSNIDLKITAFYDVNGDRVCQKDEIKIENVVIRLNKDEVITNVNGEAVLKNLPLGKAGVHAFGLDSEKGWFPNIADSVEILLENELYIPFTRGVKVRGEIVVDRQKIVLSDTDKKLDLSNIKVSAINEAKVHEALTNKNGVFEFYIPNGDYIFSIDEKILGSKYLLSQNNIEMSISQDLDGLFISFFITEKRRKVIKKVFNGDKGKIILKSKK